MGLRLFFLILLAVIPCAAQVDLSKPSVLRVIDQSEGLIILPLPAIKTQLSPFVVFVRKHGNDFDVIARGKLETIQDNKILVSLQTDSIIKFPLKGDYAVPLGTPRDWPPDTDPRIMEPPLSSEEGTPPSDPGYIEYDMGQLSGSAQASASDDTTDAYKNLPKYAPAYTHFIWYFEFLWHLGFETETWNGTFPTSTYYHDFGDSKEKLSITSINYRFYRLWLNEHLRPTLRFLTTNSTFSTLNTDEALLSSSVTATGLGTRLSYEWDSTVWKPEKGSGFKFQSVFLDLNYYPIVTVQDTGPISRGTGSAGSSMSDFKIGASTIMYVKWIPWIKRYILEAGYGQRNISMKFSGPTTSQDPNSGYQIPSGVTGTEKYNWFYVSVGVRFEDFVGQLLKPR